MLVRAIELGWRPYPRVRHGGGVGRRSRWQTSIFYRERRGWRGGRTTLWQSRMEGQRRLQVVEGWRLDAGPNYGRLRHLKDGSTWGDRRQAAYLSSKCSGHSGHSSRGLTHSSWGVWRLGSHGAGRACNACNACFCPPRPVPMRRSPTVDLSAAC